MKKQMERWLLGAAFCGMLAMTGCGGGASEAEEISPEQVAEYVQEAQEMLEEADSFTADFKVESQMRDEDPTVTEGVVTMVKEPLFMLVDTSLNFIDRSLEYDTYLEEAVDAVNQYMNYDGQWTEMTMTEDAALTGVQIYNTLYNLETILSAGENWTVTDNGKELKLTGVIPEAKFSDVEEYTRWFQLAGMSGLSEVYYAGVGDVPVTVLLDEKTGAPLSYEVELAKTLEIMTNNVLRELSGGELQNAVEVKNYTITSALTQLGGVEAGEVPAEAKNDAINYEKEISFLENE